MRPGGGKDKGSAFERVVCRQLSLWLTNGARADVFTRNIISGGQFTRRVAEGSVEHGMPGDIMASHPLAYTFLCHFLVECKHHKDIGIDTYIYDMRGTSSLAKIISKCRREADHAALYPMLVVKQNSRPPLVMLSPKAAACALESVSTKLKLPYHVLHSGMIYVFDFNTFTQSVWASRMLDLLKLIGN